LSGHTELNLIFALKSETPGEIVDVLLFMTRQREKKPQNIPAHPLFETALWPYMLCDYRQSDTGAGIYSNARLERSEYGRHLVSIRCDCPNADGEIGHFLDWIMPYIHARRGDFLGYKRAENSEAVTIVIYAGFQTTQSVPGEHEGLPI
jgi:hypothetical protein